ncbi:glycoside hydrolase family 16 protein [Mesoflavibacter zeaxanthinifaciens]|uniref:glycoside hydrolase family 16 protein n=1 Tax=Mesoflavibacter zeaxanthinifaciens TaxID=393060 RepID=UPI0026EE14E2|nr:glycoside hydrolase family 16 protein [Mesoflavibacter zeaxanthinifaciens]
MKHLLIIISLITIFSCKEEKQENIVFFEDFNTENLNENHWNYELGNGCPNLCGWGNNERQYYTKENVSIKDGNLVITATKDSTKYYSGRITTKDKVEFTYGTVEVKAKLPLGHGLWPAIWMLGSDIEEVGWPACGEIDIMEYVGKTPHEIHTTLHTPSSFGQSINTNVETLENIEEGFHVYKTNWSKDAIKFYIDNQLVYTFSPEEKDKKNYPFNKPFFVILNMAIGGSFGGPDVDDSIFPQQFIIDYIKIYQ